MSSATRNFPRISTFSTLPGVDEVTIFCGSMVGASLGFLWYNAHPAEVFMGDVGSLALGGAIGTVAVIIKQELLLVFVGGVFVIEALSVMIQVAVFQAARQAGFPNVADSPSLRIERMEGIEGHHSLLDRGVDLCVVQSFDFEIEVGRMKWC